MQETPCTSEDAVQSVDASEPVSQATAKPARRRLFHTKSNPIPEKLPDNPKERKKLFWRAWWHSTWLLSLVCVYLELCLHLCVFRSMDSRILYPILFGILAGNLMALVCTALPRIPGRVLTYLLVLVLVLYAEVQLVYQAIFGNFMPISLAGMGEGVVTNFGAQILFGIRENIFSIVLLLLPLVLMGILTATHHAPRGRVSWRQSLASAGVAFCTIVTITALMLAGQDETFSVYEIFTNVNTSTDTSYKNIGMLATTEQELRYMLLGVDQDNGELSSDSLGRTKPGANFSSREYNVMDIDFTAMAESTDDEMLKALDQYFATVVPTRKNDYTGMLSDYNLITICAESFCPYFISEELTPALYQMSTTGILFNNYYGTFQSVTTNGEYTMNMGLFPDMSRTKTQSSFDLSASNYLPFCLGNALKAEGYQTWAYHNYIGEFYNRSLTHPNMGYTFQAADSGLNIQVDWPSSDLDMIVESVDDYIDTGSPFHAYYMTFSGHYQYNWENAMSAKNRAAVEDLGYSDTVKAYIACNLELEYAMEYLLERLEQAGIADKTCIVLTNDHYPYGLTEEEYNELAGEELDSTFEKYRNAFICYVPGLRENIEVDNYCSTQDILPTLLNLFGIEYDSRLLAGRDVLAKGTHIAILYDQSFLTDGFRFDASSETLYSDDESELSEEILDKYRLYVSNAFVLSTDILDTDYYAHVFGKVSGDSGLEDTVVFTDITNIFNQASVLYMYRNGFVDPESEDTFGGRMVSEVGEFVDVLYRIADRPAYTDAGLPEGYVSGDFNTDYPYYAAVCWAYENGILQEDDMDEKWSDDVDYRTASLLITRFAQYLGVDTTLDQTLLDTYIEEHPRLPEEVVHAILWVDSQNITARDSALEDLFDNYAARISRYQMTSFLFYFCTYVLQLEG